MGDRIGRTLFTWLMDLKCNIEGSGPLLSKILVILGLARWSVHYNDNKLFTRWRPPSILKLFPSTAFVPIEHDAAKAKKLMSLFCKFNEAQKLVASIESISKNQLRNNWEGKDEVKVHPLVNMYTFTLACHLFLSINDIQKVSKLLYHFNHLNDGILALHLNIAGTPFYRAIKAAEALREEIYLIIKERREALAKNLASPTQDVLSQMIAVPCDDGFMTELEIADKILAFLIGGQDTCHAPNPKHELDT